MWQASGGVEHFISFEVPDQSLLLGFLRYVCIYMLRPKYVCVCVCACVCACVLYLYTHTHTSIYRLRFNEDDRENVFPELKHAALIRELHVYGSLHTNMLLMCVPRAQARRPYTQTPCLWFCAHTHTHTHTHTYTYTHTHKHTHIHTSLQESSYQRMRKTPRNSDHNT